MKTIIDIADYLHQAFRFEVIPEYSSKGDLTGKFVLRMNHIVNSDVIEIKMTKDQLDKLREVW